jgi:hypothetical protein
MASHFRDVTLGDGRNSLRATLNSFGEASSGYFIRYRCRCIFIGSSRCVGVCPELELADRRSTIPRCGSPAVCVDDVPMCETNLKNTRRNNWLTI